MKLLIYRLSDICNKLGPVKVLTLQVTFDFQVTLAGRSHISLNIFYLQCFFGNNYSLSDGGQR